MRGALAEIAEANDADRTTAQLQPERRGPFAVPNPRVGGGDVPHQGDDQPKRQLGRAPGRAAAHGPRHGNSKRFCRFKIDVVSMHAGLSEDAQIGELLQELPWKSRSLAICDDRIEASKRLGRSERLSEDVHLGALSQSRDGRLAVVRLMNVVENCDSHGALPVITAWPGTGIGVRGTAVVD